MPNLLQVLTLKSTEVDVSKTGLKLHEESPLPLTMNRENFP